MFYLIGSKPELQMMYAGSKLNLVKEAQVTKVWLQFVFYQKHLCPGLHFWEVSAWGVVNPLWRWEISTVAKFENCLNLILLLKCLQVSSDHFLLSQIRFCPIYCFFKHLVGVLNPSSQQQHPWILVLKFCKLSNICTARCICNFRVGNIFVQFFVKIYTHVYLIFYDYLNFG